MTQKRTFSPFMKIYRLLRVATLTLSFFSAHFSHSAKKGAKKSLCEVNNLILIFCIDKVPFTIVEKKKRICREGAKKMLFNKNKHQEIPETWFKFIIFFLLGCCMNKGKRFVGGKMVCSCSIYVNETSCQQLKWATIKIIG